METVTYSQLQELVRRLPAKNLPTAYRLLAELSVGEIDSPSLQQEFMLLPLAERRRLMAEQAKQMLVHYAQMPAERQAWQTGKFTENNTRR